MTLSFLQKFEKRLFSLTYRDGWKRVLMQAEGIEKEREGETSIIDEELLD